MSREKPPLRLDADFFLSRHLAQMFERALSMREWSSAGLLSGCVSMCESKTRFLSAVVPYPFRDGRHWFSETNKPDGYPLPEWQPMVLSETRGLWLSWIVRGGIG